MKRNILGLCPFVWTLAIAGTTFGAVATDTWTADATSLADGKVTLSYDASGAVTNLVADATDGAITLTGTETLSFADGAELRVQGEELRFELPVAGVSNLTISATQGAIVCDLSKASPKTVFPEQESNAVVVVANTALTNVCVDFAYYDRGNASYVVIAPVSVGHPFHEKRGDGTYTCQMQVVDGGWAKCVELCLKQSGNDIVGWTPKAWYTDTVNYGVDYRNPPAGVRINDFNLYQPGETVNGYSIDYLVLMPMENKKARVTFTQPVDVAGTLRIDRTASVTLEGDTALTNGAAWHPTLALDGALTLHNPGGVRIDGTVTYGLDSELAVVADAVHAGAPSVLELEDDLPGTNWTVVARGLSIRAITNVTACIGNSGWFGTKGYQLGTYRFTRTNYDREIDCQFQYWDGSKYVKGVAYRLRETNDCIEARVVRAGYWDSSASGTGKLGADVGERDLTDATRTSGMTLIYAGGTAENGYGIGDIKLYLDETPYGRTLDFGLKAVNGTEGHLTLRGTANERLFVRATEYEAINVSLTVETNTICDFRPYSTSNSKNIGQDRSYCIHAGGELWHRDGCDWAFDQVSSIVLTGGVFYVAHWSDKAKGSIINMYLNGITFADGGRLAGYPPRAGYYRDPVWTVRGQSPAFIDPGLGIVGMDGANKVRTNLFNVADVTGDAAADLTIGGRLFYSNKDWMNGQLVKKGAGTVLHLAANSVTNLPLRILGGTWRLGVTGSTTADNPLSLEGGTVAVADGCTNAFGAVTLAAGTANGVALGAESALAFTSYAPGAGATLAVEAPVRKPSFRIGTSHGLTGAQLKSITVNGESVHQDSHGYVWPGLAGAVILIR